MMHPIVLNAIDSCAARRHPLPERIRRYRAWLQATGTCCGHPGPALRWEQTARGPQATCMVCETQWVEV